jgi:arabinose-5-phosphate isomerase
MTDALAATVMRLRGFTAEQFAFLHLGGQLGRNLTLRVTDVMHSGENLPRVRLNDNFKDVIIEISAKGLGAACVVDESDRLLGIVTDGDVRRMLQRNDDIRSLDAGAVMSVDPVIIDPGSPLERAMRVMEDRPSQISVLPVVEGGRCIGIIRVHDILLPQVR